MASTGTGNVRIVGAIHTRRVYDRDEPIQGKAFLVDRLWPRGVRKADLAGVEWLKDLAPSDDLRRWFGHDPDRWEEFERRYRDELAKAGEAMERVLDAAGGGPVTLLYAAKDTEHNNAVVIKKYVEERLG